MLTADGTKIVHMRDRWTGQAWIARYTKNNIEIEPVPFRGDIQKKKEEILKRPGWAEINQMLSEKIAQKTTKQSVIPSPEKTKEPAERAKSPSQSLTPYEIDIEKYKRIGAEVAKKYKAYEEIRAFPNAFDLESLDLGFLQELLKLHQSEAEEAAKSELLSEAYIQQNIATAMWVALVATSAIVAVILFIRDSRNRQHPQASVL